MSRQKIKTSKRPVLLLLSFLAVLLAMHRKRFVEIVLTPYLLHQESKIKTGKAVGENSSFWSTVRNFKPHEFDSSDAPGSGHLMNHEFVKFLDDVRDFYGSPIIISNGYRTKKKNASIRNSKGVQYSAKNSPHMYGIACDIMTSDEDDTAKLLNSIVQIRNDKYKHLKLGVGVYGSAVRPAGFFIHVDTRTHKAVQRNVIWTGNQYRAGGYRLLRPAQIARFKKIFNEIK